MGDSRTTVRISSDFGIVVRKDSLERLGISRGSVLKAIEAGEPFDESPTLLSFGPHFGEEAADTLSSQLQELGLIYIEDFFVFSGDFPDWCEFHAAPSPNLLENPTRSYEPQPPGQSRVQLRHPEDGDHISPEPR